MGVKNGGLLATEGLGGPLGGREDQKMKCRRWEVRLREGPVKGPDRARGGPPEGSKGEQR